MAAVITPPETRIVLENISWETYERLLAERGDRAGRRFAYDDGCLEIMVPSLEHEEPAFALNSLVEQVAAELNINFRRAGSTTFNREDLSKGFEPDASFYIQNHLRVKGKKRIDLTRDPPPDLVIEVDVTSSSLPRFPIFAGIGVPEVWRFDGERVRFFALTSEGYAEIEHSVALPPLTGEVATRFLRENGEMDSNEWMRSVRAWARSQAG